MFFAYHKHAIITRGLYIFKSIFLCGLYCKAVNITNNLCTKLTGSSIFGPKIDDFTIKSGFKSKGIYNGVPVSVNFFS